MKVNSLPTEIGAARDGGPIAKNLAPPKTETSKADNVPAVRSAEPPTQAAAAIPPIVNGMGLGLHFHIDKETGRSVIRVLDVESGKVVRQIPAEEVLAFLRQIEEQKGPILSVKL